MKYLLLVVMLLSAWSVSADPVLPGGTGNYWFNNSADPVVWSSYLGDLDLGSSVQIWYGTAAQYLDAWNGAYFTPVDLEYNSDTGGWYWAYSVDGGVTQITSYDYGDNDNGHFGEFSSVNTLVSNLVIHSPPGSSWVGSVGSSVPEPGTGSLGASFFLLWVAWRRRSLALWLRSVFFSSESVS